MNPLTINHFKGIVSFYVAACRVLQRLGSKTLPRAKLGYVSDDSAGTDSRHIINTLMEICYGMHVHRTREGESCL